MNTLQHPNPSSSVGLDFIPERPVGQDDIRPNPGTSIPKEQNWRPSMDSLDGWQDFELIPPDYRARKNAQRVLHRWSAVLLLLLTATVGSFVALWVRGQNAMRQNERLVERAAPIADTRQQAQVLETENVLLEKWCRWVESAKPDDSIVQVLTAASLATQHGDPMPEKKHLDVQSVEVKLPREYDPSANSPPTWSEPRFRLTVTAKSRDVLLPWNERLEKTGRLEAIKLATPGGAWREAMIQVNAMPLSTRTVP